MAVFTKNGFAELSHDDMLEINGGWVEVAFTVICAAYGAAVWLGDQHGRRQAYKDRYGK